MDLMFPIQCDCQVRSSRIRAYKLTLRTASDLSCICTLDDEGNRLTALERILLKKDAISAETFSGCKPLGAG